MATGNSKRSGLGRGLGALITKTDAESATAQTPYAAEESEVGQPQQGSGPDNRMGQDQRDGQVHGDSGQRSGTVAGATGSSAGPSVESGGTFQVPLAAITPNPHQPRSHFELEALEELAASIREHGIIQPLIVTQAKADQSQEDQAGIAQPRYWLIAGERRLRVAQLANLGTVPVIVREASARQLVELALIENIQREDLNPLEEAAAYQALMDDYDLTQALVAERVGKSRSAVANAVRLLHLSANVQNALLAKTISPGHARALLGLIDDDKMDLALKQILSRQLSVRQTEALVKELVDREEAAYDDLSLENSEDPLASHWLALEGRFRNALGTKVALNRNADGTGRLVVHFYNDDDLDSLLHHIAGEDEELH